LEKCKYKTIYIEASLFYAVGLTKKADAEIRGKFSLMLLQSAVAGTS
jgi:hypothetical protein